MNHVTLLPAVLPEMFPVTQELSSIKVAGKTIAEHIVTRLATRCDSRHIVARADFFPSMELAGKVANANCNLRVIDPTDGTVLIRLALQGADHVEELFADQESIRLRFAWDLLRLTEALVSALDHDEILGTVREGVTIDGHIILGKNSVLLPGVYIEGNAVFGENCKIGPNCYIRGNTSVGDNCHIGQAVEVKNSLFFDHVSAGHLSYMGDSVVCNHVNFGAGTVVSNLRHDGRNHRFRVGNVLLDTGRRKFGAIIGENVHTGIHTAIYPGRSLPPGTATEPGEVVRR